MQLMPSRASNQRVSRHCATLAASLLSFLLWGCAFVAPLPETKEAAVTQAGLPTAARQARLGLALGGGAARGFAHIGVIQVLEEAGLRADVVVGTSAGSVVATLYASGKTGAQLQSVAQGMEEASLSDWRLPLFKPGILKGEALARFISKQVDARQLQDLALRVGVVATDLHSGQAVLFERGDTATAVRASSAIPALFEPVSIAGREYVDGGLVSPVPVRFARQMGADVVVAVDISNPPEVNPTHDTLSILLQTFSIMGQSLSNFELKDADVVVKPVLTGLPSARFSARAQAIAAGRLAMQQVLPRLLQALAAKSR